MLYACVYCGCIVSRRVQFVFFFSSRRRHTRCGRDWSSDVCSSDLYPCDRRQSKKLNNLFDATRRIFLLVGSVVIPAVLGFLWLLGLVAGFTLGGFIHLLLVLAVMLFPGS